MSSDVEKELWEIFTYYTIHGNSLDPFHISVSSSAMLLMVAGVYNCSHDSTLIRVPPRVRLCAYGRSFGRFPLQYNALVRLCKDANLFEKGAFPGKLIEADVFVLFASEARNVDQKASHGSDRHSRVIVSLSELLPLADIFSCSWWWW